MNRSKQPSKTAVAFCAAAVIGVALAAIPSRAEDVTLGKTIKPLTGISFGVGSKRVVGYFVSDAQVCDLTLMMGDSIQGDEVPMSTPTRIRQTIAPNNTARVDTMEGESLEFSCKAGATAMTVQMLKNVAAYKAK
jgi:hypothetical protein